MAASCLSCNRVSGRAEEPEGQAAGPLQISAGELRLPPVWVAVGLEGVAAPLPRRLCPPPVVLRLASKTPTASEQGLVLRIVVEIAWASLTCWKGSSWAKLSVAFGHRGQAWQRSLPGVSAGRPFQVPTEQKQAGEGGGEVCRLQVSLLFAS